MPSYFFVPSLTLTNGFLDSPVFSAAENVLSLWLRSHAHPGMKRGSGQRAGRRTAWGVSSICFLPHNSVLFSDEGDLFRGAFVCMRRTSWNPTATSEFIHRACLTFLLCRQRARKPTWAEISIINEVCPTVTTLSLKNVIWNLFLVELLATNTNALNLSLSGSSYALLR